MAQYKVPQDVEADDKLLGPFTFRQFIYLLVVAGLIAMSVALFQLAFPLAILPLPFIVLFGALALPLKKDQPMETYLSALVSFYLKPNKRYWMPGQRESTIEITAPKIAEPIRVRNISQGEAGSHLSFLADLVDTEGASIRGATPMREEYVAEAKQLDDIYAKSSNFDNLLSQQQYNHDQIVNQMRDTIEKNNSLQSTENTIQKHFNPSEVTGGTSELPSIKPLHPTDAPLGVTLPPAPDNIPVSKTATVTKRPSENIAKLASNQDYSVETIAKEAKRIKDTPPPPPPPPEPKDENEVYVSLR